jgi:hypothetical protein
MSMNDAQALASARRCYQIAPAGCGKTQLIADAVAQHSSGRVLILTHTHAGVDALRRRLTKATAKPANSEVDTIASWALRYASAFPISSGLANHAPQDTKHWSEVYAACLKLLAISPICEVIAASYSAVFVDEYQDCSVEQHTIICKLADFLPCRLLGDPLQGIFDFNKTEMVDWKKHIEPTFSALPELSKPWRWENVDNAKLGAWLFEVRKALTNGSPINLSTVPACVTWIRSPSDGTMQHTQRLKVLKMAAELNGSVVAIMKWEAECNKLVSNLPFQYGNLETMACDDLMDAAEALDNSIGVARMDVVVEFACKCANGLKAELKTVVLVLRGAAKRQNRQYTRQREMELLATVISDKTLETVGAVLEGLIRTPNVTLWRKELHYEMQRTLKEFATGAHSSLKAAAWAVRNRTRHSERRMGQRIVSRTLLVKGLEFDHCVVLNADALTLRELYVALTRGAKSITIISKSSSLTPAN